jgi:transposase
MPEILPKFECYTGVDIAAQDFTAATMLAGAKPKPEAKPFPQTATGFQQFKERLLLQKVAATSHLIVMEATGTYWIALAISLYEAGFVVSVVNPAQAHYFAKAQLKRAKSDLLDAQTLAQLGQALELPSWTPPPQSYHELRQRLSQRDSLLKLGNQVQNQLQALLVNPIVIQSVQTQLEELITTFSKQLKTMDTEIKALLKADSAWNKSIALLQTIPGVGVLTACWLVVATLNFTVCHSPEELVHYVGLAPLERTSGTSIRGRPSIGHSGHFRLRSLLYLGTLSAVRFNPAIKVFWERLRLEKQKPSKVARCACARKMLHIAFAVVTSGKAFDPNYQAASKETKPNQTVTA